VLEGKEWRRLLDAIPTDTVRDLRDRALIATLTYGFARIGAALKMRVEDLQSKGSGWLIRLHEKGGKQHMMPCSSQPSGIQFVAQEQSINPTLVEKDYWITHCLYGLQKLGLKLLKFELKGAPRQLAVQPGRLLRARQRLRLFVRKNSAGRQSPPVER
jgi:hypothetical protein